MELTLESITKLNPQKDDVIVCRLSQQPTPETMQGLIDLFRANGVDALLLFVEDDSDIYILDEGRMAKFGWVRS